MGTRTRWERGRLHVRVRRVCASLVVGLGGLLAVAASEVAGASGVPEWGPVTEVLPSGSDYFTSVSCISIGNCTAIGSNDFATETNGLWNSAAPISVSGSNNFTSVSCTSVGNCTAVGAGITGNDDPIASTETNGTWGSVVVITAPDGYVMRSVSCTSAGNCTAVGIQNGGDGQLLYATEADGTWGSANLIAAPGGYGGFSGVSCTSAGNCVAVGGDGRQQPIYANESNGTWGPATEIDAATGGFFNGVSCSSAGNCTAVGSSAPGDPNATSPISATETGGTWGPATGVTVSTPSYFNAVSCTSAGQCTAVGIADVLAANTNPIASTDTNGVWQVATDFSVLGSNGSLFDSVSCTSAGHCTAVGRDGNGQPIYAAEAVTDTVTTCSGDPTNPGSLPYEVAHAAPGDTIDFSVVCPPGSPIVLNSTIDITQNLTIDGPGESDLVVSGGNAVEVFDVASGVTVTISGISVEHGNADDGGGIDNGGTLTLSNSALTDNSADAYGDTGGGIYSDGTLNLTDSTVSGNSDYTNGGGIYSDGTLNVTDSTVSGNSGEEGAVYSEGGAIYSESGMATITNSTLSDNSADFGGGIYSNGTLAIIESTLSDNNALNGWGGGVLSGSGTTTTVTNSTLSGNNGDVSGGGIFNYGTLTVANSTVFGNMAPDGNGGGIENFYEDAATVANSTVAGNSAGYSGGGIDNGGTFSISATIVANNTGLVGDCSGEAFTDLGYNLDDDGSCDFTTSNDLSDTPAGLNPAGLQNNGGPTQTIALEPGSAAIGAVNSVSLCSTPDQRGVARPTPCDIGAYETAGDLIVTNCNDSGTGSLRQAILDATSGNSITFALSPTCSTITLASTIDITADLTIDGPGASALAVSGGDSVEVFDVMSTTAISELTIEDGNATNGGGIGYFANLSLTNCVLSNNKAAVYGGGIYGDGLFLTLTNTTVANNSAQLGGAMYMAGESADLNSSTISNNHSTDNAGGIANTSAMTVSNSTVTGNTTTGDGGGIENFDALSVFDSTFSGNTATGGGGGGIFSGGTSLTVTGSTLSGNSASVGAGGGISGPASLSGTIVANSPAGGACSGAITDLGYNLDDDGTCGLNGTSLSDTPAGLDTAGLQSNGGPTQTIALEPGSAAIRAVSYSTLCSTPDQRGIARPTPCDIGAFEFTTNNLSQGITFGSTPPSPAYVGGPAYVASATASSGLAVVLTVDSSASSVCSISGGVVSFIGPGACTIDANQAGNAIYSPAPQAQQIFTTTTYGGGQPPPAPTFTSSAMDSVLSGVPFTFKVTVTPASFFSSPTITHLRRHFPSWLTLIEDSFGSATLTSSDPVVGVYHFVLVATNGGGTTEQKFTLTVSASSSPVFTSASSATTGPGAFTFSVTASGTPTPTISGSGLPSWLTLTDKGGTATLNAAKALKGKYSFTLTATSAAGSASQTFMLKVT